MDGSISRRQVLLGGTGLAGVLAGCSNVGVPRQVGDTPTFTPVPLPESDVDPTSIAAVGSRVAAGPLALVVTGVDSTSRAVILGREVDPGDDDQFLVVDATFKNAADDYVALVVDRFDVAASGGFYDSVEPFTAFTSPAFGGWAFAPGELRTVRLHYAVPARTQGLELRAALRVRTLPGDAFDLASPVVVDLEASVSSPVRLRQSLTAPVHEPGDRVSTVGMAVHVRRVVSGVDLLNWNPAEEHEFLAVNLAVANDEGSTPAAVGIGGFGGMTVADDRGIEYTTTRWFPGEIAGGPYYDDGRAVAPGETREGTMVVEVPDGARPLYLLWTPPPARWRGGTGVAVNRHVWRLR